MTELHRRPCLLKFIVQLDKQKMFPLQTTLSHHRSTPVLFAAVNSTTTDPEHTVPSPHNTVSPPLHTCPVCCCQQHSHSSSAPKIHPSFIRHDDFIHGKVFCWIVHFTKFIEQSVKNLSYFPKSIVVWVVTARRVVVVFKMEESNVEKAVARHHI